MKKNFLNEIKRNLKKDIQVEFRSRSAMNIAIAFAGISTLSISLVAGGTPFSPTVLSILLWIIIFFSAMNGLSHIFTRETDEGTALFLSLNSGADAIFASKLIFNIIFLLVIEAVIIPLFIVFLGLPVKALPEFLFTVTSGGVALAGSTTLLGAMTAKAGGRGSLFTVISFPVILPVLLIAVKTTIRTLESASPDATGNIVFFLAFSGVLISLSLILFPIIWQEQ